MSRAAPSIDAYGDGGFRLDGIRHEGSLLIVADQARRWEVTSLAQLTPASLAPVLEAGRAEVEFLLLGVGARNAQPPRQVREALQRMTSQPWAASRASVSASRARLPSIFAVQ